jgi:hypothetical protein
MAAKKRVDPIKQREKRAKIAAAVGGVLFLALAAIQAPKIMKMMHPKPVVPPPTRVANPDGSVPGGAQTQTTPTGVAADGRLADTDVPLASDGAQLVSFEVFDTKNPFRPQVTESATSGDEAAATTPDATATTPTTPPTTTDATTTTPEPTTTTPETPPSAIPSTPTTTTTPSVPARPTVKISVNGTVAKISNGGTFPSGAPVFRLVSWTKDEAEIGIVGGSYASGDQTLRLQLGKPVTLRNTSDGKQYKLVLLSTP